MRQRRAQAARTRRTRLEGWGPRACLELRAQVGARTLEQRDDAGVDVEHHRAELRHSESHRGAVVDVGTEREEHLHHLVLVESRLESKVEGTEAREGGHRRDVLGEAREQVPGVLDATRDDAAAHVARILAEDVRRVGLDVGAGVEQGGEDGGRGEGGGGDEGRHVGRVVV